MSTNPNVPANLHLSVREDWLASTCEAALEPEIRIVDPHHHLWDGSRGRYLFDEIHRDVTGGHNVLATVFVECFSMWRADGPEAWRPLGETQFVAGHAAMAESGQYGPCRIAAGIVGHVDLRNGAEVRPILEQHVQRAGGRFRGIRQSAVWDADPVTRNTTIVPPRHLLGNADFRTGFAELGRLGLSFDAWIFHTQLLELRDLARAFPDTTIVLNHVGGPIGVGAYADRREEVFALWRTSMGDLATCPNVVVKVGGLGLRVGWSRFHLDAEPPSSARLADAWRPWIETTIEIFGAERCMFESNFPVDKAMYAYANGWNAFKRLTSHYSADERDALFYGTASKTYRLDP